MARIALIVEASSGGVGTHVAGLAHALLRRGHTLWLIYSPLRSDDRFLSALSSMQTFAGFSAHCLPIRHQLHPLDAQATLRIAAVLRRQGPFDVIHCHSTKAGFVGRLAALGAGARIVYTPHALLTMAPGVGKIKYFLASTLERALALTTGELIAVSDQERSHMRDIGLPADRTRVIFNGIDVDQYRPEPGRRIAARRELGLQPREICIGFIGRFAPQKNPELLLRALQLAAARWPCLQLAVVGSGPLAEAMRELARALCIEGQVIWCGDRNAADVLPAFDIFALSSRYESCPYVIMEAMAAGVPVVATAVGGVRDLVEDGGTGLLVPEGNVNAFRDAILALSKDPVLRSHMSRRACVRAEQFSLEGMVDKLEEAYCAQPATRLSLPNGVPESDGLSVYKTASPEPKS